MPHNYKKIKLDIWKGVDDRQSQIGSRPAAPSGNITLEDSSAMGSNHFQQEKSKDSFASSSPADHHQPPAAQSFWGPAHDAFACLQAFCLSRNGNSVKYDWYKDRIESRVGSSCEWILRDLSFHWWRLRESGPLMVSAVPGCGKSVLAKYLIDEGLSQQSATICYFFFTDQHQNTIRQALCALLHQLFSKKEALIQHAMELYRKKGENLVQSEPSLWRILRLAVRDARAGSVIFFIDALDECDKSQLKSLITNFKIIIGHPDLEESKKVIMTSRPSEQVVSLFDSLQSLFPRTHTLWEDEHYTIDQEINSVIRHRIEQLAEIHQLSDFLKYRLSAYDHRNHLLVCLLFDYIDKRLPSTDDEIRAAILAFPKSVNEAYDQVLNRFQDDVSVKTIRKALSIMLAARRPWTISEMNIAMSLNGQSQGQSIHDLDLEQDVDFQSRLQTLCGLFVNVHDNKIYIFHQTAREFLLYSSAPTTIRAELQWYRSITTRYAHSVLAEICMVYLDMLNSTDTGAFCQGDRYGSLLQYSVEHWGDHCREAEFETGSAMVDLASALCTSDFTSHSKWAGIISKQYHIRPESSPNVSIPSHVGHTLLSSGADLEAKDSRGRTALVIATESGNEAATGLLLKDGADVEARDEDGWTALICAAIYSREAVTRLLLKNGANIEATDDSGWTALMHSARSGIKAITRLLLVFDANVDARDDDGGTALTYAAKSGHEAVARLLLENGADVEARDENGWTALMHAARSGHEAVTRLLLDNSADAETADYDVRTPLMCAAEFGSEAVTRLLLDKGAGIEEEDEYRSTALMYTAIYDQEAVARLLIEYGVDLDAGSGSHWTALMYAVIFDNEAVTRLLLENCADVEARDEEDWTVLMFAAKHGHEAVTRLLLECGAEVEAGTDFGQAALIYAVESGHEAIIQLLFDNGANIEATGEDRMTPLMFAAKYGHESVVQLLLKNGADVEAKDYHEWTASLYAEKYRHGAVMQLLDDVDKTNKVWTTPKHASKTKTTAR